jgi:hypothetical protein
MTRWMIAAALLVGACACPNKQATGPGSGSGNGSGSGSNVTQGGACDGIRARVEQLYRAEAQAKEPKRVDEAVSDNTTMVMNDCAKAPDKVAACVKTANSVAEIEQRCLIPLDDEGTEGEAMRK